MSNIIKHIHIEKLFGTTNIDWELNPSVNVLVGKNGSGKSTILNIIQTTLSQTTFQNEITDAFRVCNINMKDGDDFKCEIINTLKLLDSSKSHKLIKDKLIQKNMLVPMWSTYTADYPNICIEFISTVNLSSSAISSYTDSNGRNKIVLNEDINDEVLRLLTFHNKEILKENLLLALNSLFSETNKIIAFDNNNLVVKLTDGTQIDFSQLSSGERQVIFIFLKVVIASVDGALILMDEPEISLHLSWQEKLLNEIRKVNKTSQIIIVTHSPAMLMNGWLDSFVDIENIMTDVTTSEEE